MFLPKVVRSAQEQLTSSISHSHKCLQPPLQPSFRICTDLRLHEAPRALSSFSPWECPPAAAATPAHHTVPKAEHLGLPLLFGVLPSCAPGPLGAGERTRCWWTMVDSYVFQPEIMLTWCPSISNAILGTTSHPHQQPLESSARYPGRGRFALKSTAAIQEPGQLARKLAPMEHPCNKCQMAC